MYVRGSTEALAFSDFILSFSRVLKASSSPNPDWSHTNNLAWCIATIVSCPPSTTRRLSGSGLRHVSSADC